MVAGARAPEARRYAAVLILRELAANAPTVFNVHVPAFIDAIWPALRDPRMNVRLAAVRALRECLVVIEKRETRYRVQWYYKLYEETQNGISTKMASVEQTHGSLLAFGEMLRHTGEFMLSRYKEVAETVLRLHDSRERIVRRSVVELIPKLAAFAAEVRGELPRAVHGAAVGGDSNAGEETRDSPPSAISPPRSPTTTRTTSRTTTKAAREADAARADAVDTKPETKPETVGCLPPRV